MKVVPGDERDTLRVAVCTACGAGAELLRIARSGDERGEGSVIIFHHDFGLAGEGDVVNVLARVKSFRVWVIPGCEAQNFSTLGSQGEQALRLRRRW